MNLGKSLADARKHKGLSQEETAEKLGVSRQTVSKWETGETLPDIQQSKRLAVLYGRTLDELIAFDLNVSEIQEVIDRTGEEVNEKIDWTKAWGKKYPVLLQYKEEVDVVPYAEELKKMLRNLENTYQYNQLEAFLVLKDILAGVWSAGKTE